MSDVFSGNPDNENPEVDVIDPDKDYFTELVGEGRTYKDEKALARATAEKERHIRRVESENAQLRSQVNASSRLEEIADRLSKAQRVDQSEAPTRDQEIGSVEKVLDQEAFDPTKIDELISKRMEAREAQRRQEANIAEVDREIRKVYGHDAQNVIIETARTLGMSLDQLKAIGAQNPKALYRMVGIERSTPAPEQGMPNAPQTRVSSVPASGGGSFKPSAQKRNWSYYEAMRKSPDANIRKEYNSSRVSWQMDQDAQEQGESFFS